MKNPGFRWLSPDKIQALLDVALGKGEADLVVSNGDLVNVYTGEIQRKHTVAVKHNRVAYVGKDTARGVGPSTTVIDATGKTVIPGLVDGHTHMLSITPPWEYTRHATVHGTTTIITEVQEVTFPIGIRGGRYFMNYLKDQPIKFFFMAPPLVTPSPSARANYIPATEMDRLLADERVLGLGETYWLPTIQGEKRILELLSQTLAWGKKVDGHSAGARNDKLVAYFASGVTSCHESTTLEETIEKLRLGVSTMVREGGVRTELPVIAKIQQQGIDLRLFSLVSDGVSPEIFLQKGYMDYIVTQAIRYGLKPVTAIQAATINTAVRFSLDDVIGGIAPGKFADILVIPDIETIRPEWVISNGKVAARDGQAMIEPPRKAWPRFITRSLCFPRRFDARDFHIEAPVHDGRVKARVIDQITELVTRELTTEVPVAGGGVTADTGEDILKVAAISRAGQPGKVGMGLVKGFGLKKGAFASSGSWDCGGIVVIGADDQDMALAVNRLVELNGAAVVCAEGKVISELPMPLAGVMSDLSMEELAARLRLIQEAVESLGTKQPRVHLSLDVLTSPAIPHLRMSDAGPFSVRENSLVDLIIKD